MAERLIQNLGTIAGPAAGDRQPLEERVLHETALLIGNITERIPNETTRDVTMSLAMAPVLGYTMLRVRMMDFQATLEERGSSMSVAVSTVGLVLAISFGASYIGGYRAGRNLSLIHI